MLVKRNKQLFINKQTNTQTNKKHKKKCCYLTQRSVFTYSQTAVHVT